MSGEVAKLVRNENGTQRSNTTIIPSVVAPVMVVSRTNFFGEIAPIEHLFRCISLKIRHIPAKPPLQ